MKLLPIKLVPMHGLRKTPEILPELEQYLLVAQPRLSTDPGDSFVPGYPMDLSAFIDCLRSCWQIEWKAPQNMYTNCMQCFTPLIMYISLLLPSCLAGILSDGLMRRGCSKRLERKIMPLHVSLLRAKI